MGSNIGAVLPPARQGTLHVDVIRIGTTLWVEGHQDAAAKARPLLEKHLSARPVLVLAHPKWTVATDHSAFRPHPPQGGAQSPNTPESSVLKCNFP